MQIIIININVNNNPYLTINISKTVGRMVMNVMTYKPITGLANPLFTITPANFQHVTLIMCAFTCTKDQDCGGFTFDNTQVHVYIYCISTSISTVYLRLYLQHINVYIYSISTCIPTVYLHVYLLYTYMYIYMYIYRRERKKI